MNFSFTDRKIFAFLIALLPFFFVTLKISFVVVCGLLILLSTIVLIKHPNLKGDFFRNEYAVMVVCIFCINLFLVLFCQFLHGYISSREYEVPFRFVFAIPFLIATYAFRIEFSTYFLRLLPVAILFTGVYTFFYSAHETRLTAPGFVSIIWGDSCLVMGFICLYSLNMSDRFALKSYKLFGFSLGLYLSLLSGSRGGWFAGLILFAVWLLIHAKKLKSKKVFLYSLVAILLCVLLFYKNNIFQSRLNEMFSEIKGWHTQAKGTATSVGCRLTMWKISLYLILKHPFFGYGKNLLNSLADSKILSSANTGAIQMLGTYGPHNEVLGDLLKFGILGFLLIVVLYLLPICFFFNRRSDGLFGMIGLALCLGFFICALTNSILSFRAVSTFYAIVMAGLLGESFWVFRKSLSSENDLAIDPRTN